MPGRSKKSKTGGSPAAGELEFLNALHDGKADQGSALLEQPHGYYHYDDNESVAPAYNLEASNGGTTGFNLGSTAGFNLGSTAGFLQ